MPGGMFPDEPLPVVACLGYEPRHRGFDFARWKPRLVLIEDHVGDLSRHRFLKANGYRLVRRTVLYVPANAPVGFGLIENMRLLRKYHLALSFRAACNYVRRLRA